jgi:hypothetical protein
MEANNFSCFSHFLQIETITIRIVCNASLARKVNRISFYENDEC